MISLSLISLIILTISLIVMILASMISKKTMIDREKSSPFECGFDPKSSSRIPFSLRFFLITIIFLIFDVEIVLIMPMILTMNFSIMTMWLFNSMFFFFILLVGLYHEWNMGALEWTN